MAVKNKPNSNDAVASNVKFPSPTGAVYGTFIYTTHTDQERDFGDNETS